MKRFMLPFGLLVLLISTPFGVSMAADLKIGVTDLQRCITESEEGKRVYQELKKKKDDMQSKLDERQDVLLKLKEELEMQSMMLSMDAKEDKAKEFERRKREFKYFYEDLNDQMQKAESEAREAMLKDLEKVVEEFGKKNGFTMIFERRSSGIMYLETAIDITDKIIEAYNKMKGQ